MKIALTYRKIGPGAAVPNYCWELAQGLSRTCETWLFAREIKQPPRAVRIVRFPFSFRSHRAEHGLNSLVNKLLISLHDAKERFDVVHTQDGEMVGGDVVTAHALLRVLYRVLRTSDPQHVAWIPRSPLLWSEDLIYRTHRYHHIIASCDKVRLSLGQEYGIRDEDVTVVHLGVDGNRFRPDSSAHAALATAHSLDPNTTILLHVSTDFERKGLRTILRSLALLPPEFVLAVAGGDREEVYQDLARKLGVENRLVFLGYQENIEKIYPATDMFVFPTKFDFFGYPVLEAMACGVPPVVSSDAGVAEIIREGRDGYLLSDPEDPQELADRIESAVTSGEAPKVGARARVTAGALSIARMIEETHHVYDGLLRS